LGEEELTLMTDTLDTLTARYEAQPGLATSLLEVGESPNPSGTHETELAAWTMVASVFLNLDEALNK
jgi:hypothetical protein